MGFIDCKNEKILYIGAWEQTQDGAVSKKDFGRALLLFCGDAVSVHADGAIISSLDGGEDTAACSFTCDAGIHTLFITVMQGSILKGFDADEVMPLNDYLHEQMEAEYALIRAGRTTNGTEHWKKIPYRATMMQHDVTLKGDFAALFQKNVEHIKACFTKPGYVDVINTGMYYHLWLPAANDGRIMGGAATAYRWTSDPELRKITDAIVDKIAVQMREDGYYNYYPESDSYELLSGMNSERKNYDRTFWMFGLSAAQKAGNDKALILARRMYDWLENSKYGPQLLQSSNGTNALMGTLVLADTPAGKNADVLFNQKYLDQKYWEHELARRNPAAFSNYPGERPHCYDLLELLALAYEYRLTGEEHYLRALQGGWDIYQRYYKHVGGDAAICESNGPYYPGTYHMDLGCTGETCGSVFWVWVNRELQQLFPDDSRYAAEIEENLFNSVSSFTTEECLTRYHNRLQGEKEAGWGSGICCEVMSTLMLADLPAYVYAIGEHELWINQYISSEIRTDTLALDLDVDLWQSKCATLKVKRAAEGAVALVLRVPQWAKNLTISLNGQPISAENDAFLRIFRQWRGGDTLVISFTPEIRWVRYEGEEQAEDGSPRYAMFYGPYLMALTNFPSPGIPRLAASPTSLQLKNVAPFVYQAENSDARFVPFHTIPCGQPFCCFPIFDQV